MNYAQNQLYMKSLLCSVLWKTSTLIILLFSLVGCSDIAQAGERKPRFVGLITPVSADYVSGFTKGYLTVYLTTDGVNDRNAWYFPQSLFTIYTSDGRVFKNVESQHYADEEIPEVVALPIGSYTLVASTDKGGHVRLPLVIKAGQRTILDLDLRGKGTLSRLADD